ncbi:MAG: AAA family ATPase [Phycisphaerae bacterium]
MYREFFGLKTSPFNNTPDPRFFFNTPEHEEALASLLYAVEQRKGFVLVTGEVGSGKTLLSRILLNRLGFHVRTAVITNTRLTRIELLRSICREFELETDGCETAADLGHVLEAFLLEQYARDRLAVVILDEAQNLPTDSLEELRMLGNLEADDAKLLQVLILGQPELRTTLQQPAMQQTLQRVFSSFHIRALDRKLTEGYIAHRLRVAGLPADRTILDAEAIDAVFEYSGGIPRLINQICDNAMLAAYGESKETISAELIRETVDQTMPSKNAETPAQPDEPDPQQASLLRCVTDRLANLESSLEAIKQQGEFLRANRQGESRGDELHAERLRDLTDRIEAFETALDEVKQQKQALDSKKRDVEQDVEEARQIQQNAARMLRDVSQTAQDAERHMKDMLARAQRTAQSVEERAKNNAELGKRQSAILQEQTKSLLQEVEAFTHNQEARVAQVVSQSRSEISAVRKLREQGVELFKKMTDSQQMFEQRIRQAIEDAGAVARRLESQATNFLGDARKQTTTLEDRLRSLLKDIREKGEASQQRAAELLAQQRADIETARQNIDAFTATMSDRSAQLERESTKTVAVLKDQATSIVEQIEGIRDHTETRAKEVDASLTDFVQDMRGRIESSHETITSIVASAENEVQSACEALKSAREQILSDAEDSRWHANEMLDQTRDLLSQTRKQCATLVVRLQNEVSRQTQKAEQIWQASVREGSATLDELNTRLDEARRRSDQARADLEGLVLSATDELSKARGALDSNLNVHKAEIAKLSKDALAIKREFQHRFEEARAALEKVLQQHRDQTFARIAKMSLETNERISRVSGGADQRAEQLKAEIQTLLEKHRDDSIASVNSITALAQQRLSEAEAEARQRVEGLQGELAAASQTAEQICTGLAESVQAVQLDAADCRERLDEALRTVREEMTQLADSSRATLDETRAQVEALSTQAGGTTEKMRAEIDALKAAARSQIEQTARTFEESLTEAQARTEAISAESEARAADLAQRMNETWQKACQAIDRTDKATGLIRQQGQRSLTEVRACLAQMNERSELLRRDLARMGDDIRESAKTTALQLQRTGERVTEQIETLRQSAHKDAAANHKRLAELRQQVEQSAEQMRQNAGKLLDQVQKGAGALRQHADELLAQAQSGSEKLNESAASMLIQAQTSSERFREQAEDLLHRAEATANEIRSDVQDLRSQVVGEAEQVRQQIVAAKHDIAAGRQESADLINTAAETQRSARAKADELLKRAEAVQAQSEALMSMPKHLVDEAKRQAEALAEMSKKISTVVKQLSTAGTSAEHNKAALEKAGADADQKIDLLRRHTERVGQLVGIIRQLYGTMDARIARLRGRLSKADDLFRAMPQEIERLRAAFEDEGLDRAAAPAETLAPADAPPPGRHPAAGPTANRQTTAPGAQGHSKSTVSLGEIVKRNQKLNQWLQDVIGKETQEERSAPPTARRPSTPQPAQEQEA